MSARFTLLAQYYDGAAWQNLPNVQTISWNWGRRTITQPHSSSQATISGRSGSSFPALQVGMLIQLKITDTVKTGECIFGGQLADLQIKYGNVQNMDTYEIVVEGPFARAGRYIDDFTLTAGQKTDVAWDDYKETLPPPGQIGVLNAGTISNPAGESRSTVSAYSTNTSLAEIFTLIADTEVGRIIEFQGTDDLDQTIDLQLRQNLQQLGNNTFSDVPADWATAYAYTELEFRSLSDVYSDRVEIAPEGLPIASAGAGTRTQRFRSVDQTSIQAQAHAEYVLNLLAALGEVPFSVRAEAVNQTLNGLLSYFDQFRNGYVASIKFRGATYPVVIEGGQLNAGPENVIGTLYLSAQDQNAYLVLNDPVFGKLDENKLAF
jgi:hypothetical protein